MSRTLSEPRERRLILAFSCLAAIHVLIFSAALPFFNIVDEQAHFDLVVRYAQGDLPRSIEPMTSEAVPFMAVYGTPEIIWPLAAFPEGEVRPPPWELPFEEAAPGLVKAKDYWTEYKNHEASQPPLYYAVAGLWWRVMKSLGLEEGFLLYSVRFLNALFAMLLVWLGYTAAKLVFPERPFVRVGVAALLAFLPQTDLHSIQNDALSPVCFGALFICVLRLWRAEIPGAGLGAATGLTFAAAYLTKITNAPFLAVALAAITLKTWRLFQDGKLRSATPGLLSFTVSGGLPVALWLWRTKHFFGDFTGSAAKIEILGWTLKPFAEWWQHPLFTPPGFWKFISGLLATFWQGEFMWHGKHLNLPLVNGLYTLLSLALICFTLVQLRPQNKTITPRQRQALWLGFLTVAAGVAFLASLSVIYDFHDCFYPSREHPFFTSGRLLSGALIPFLLLFVFGADHLLSRLKHSAARPVILTGMILLMLAAKIITLWPVFFSRYNFYHL